MKLQETNESPAPQIPGLRRTPYLVPCDIRLHELAPTDGTKNAFLDERIEAGAGVAAVASKPWRGIGFLPLRNEVLEVQFDWMR